MLYKNLLILKIKRKNFHKNKFKKENVKLKNLKN